MHAFQLTGQEPDILYRRLCELYGLRHDPCVVDTIAAVVTDATGEPAHLWWVLSRQRKAREAHARSLA